MFSRQREGRLADQIKASRLSPVMGSRKLQVLEFIEAYFRLRGVGPSLGEIGAGVGISPNHAHKLVKRLAHDGRIVRARGVPRGIRPLSAREEALRLLAADGYTVFHDDKVILPPGEARAGHGKGPGNGLMDEPLPPVFDLDHDPASDSAIVGMGRHEGTDAG